MRSMHRTASVTCRRRGPTSPGCMSIASAPSRAACAWTTASPTRCPSAPSARSDIGCSCDAQLQHVFDFRSIAIDAIFEPAGDPDGAPPGTIAVAGGTGFVGGEIARELRRRGRHVVVFSSRGEGARGQLPDDIEIRRADVRDPESLRGTMTDVDELVISLAFPGLPVEQPKKGFTFMEVDAGGAERLIEAGKTAGVRPCRLHLWCRRRPRCRATLVPRQGRSRGCRARLGHGLDDHPPHLGLRTGRRLAEPLPGLCPCAALRAHDQLRQPATGAGVRARRGRPGS